MWIHDRRTSTRTTTGVGLGTRLVARLGPRRGRRSPAGERGDVPGWVMVTVMTAGLVVAVFSVFRAAIIDAVREALAQVVSTTGG